MNANPKFLAATAQVDEAAIQPLPNSRKIYVEGSRADIRVPMREILSQSIPRLPSAPRKTRRSTSMTLPGPTPNRASRSISAPACPRHACHGFLDRNDTEELPGPSSEYGVERLNDPQLAELRFNLQRKPRRALPGKNVSQMHYARCRASSRRRWNTSPFVKNMQRKEYLEQLKASGPMGNRLADLMGRQTSRLITMAALQCRLKSRQNSCARKSHAGAPSCRPISITRKSSRW